MVSSENNEVGLNILAIELVMESYVLESDLVNDSRFLLLNIVLVMELDLSPWSESLLEFLLAALSVGVLEFDSVLVFSSESVFVGLSLSIMTGCDNSGVGSQHDDSAIRAHARIKSFLISTYIKDVSPSPQTHPSNRPLHFSSLSYRCRSLQAHSSGMKISFSFP